MHTVFALLCFVVVIHWLIFPYPSGLLHWHCGNLTIAPVPAKQSWWIWIKTSCEFIMNDCITTTKQSTTKPCAYFLGYTVSIKKHVFIHTLFFLDNMYMVRFYRHEAMKCCYITVGGILCIKLVNSFIACRMLSQFYVLCQKSRNKDVQSINHYFDFFSSSVSNYSIITSE